MVNCLWCQTEAPDPLPSDWWRLISYDTAGKNTDEYVCPDCAAATDALVTIKYEGSAGG